MRRHSSAHLVDEDDARRVLARLAEDVANHTRTVAQPLLHELARHHLDEVGRRRVRHGLREHRLARARRSVH